MNIYIYIYTQRYNKDITLKQSDNKKSPAQREYPFVPVSNFTIYINSRKPREYA